MLKGIDPLLAPDLLGWLRAMGHGDEIVIADANFPAATLARRLCRVDGVDAVSMVGAILSVLPLDDFTSSAAARMTVVDAPATEPEICKLFCGRLRQAGYQGTVEPLERLAFYERARTAFAVVATGEHRLYGNLILRKGVIRPTIA